MEKQAFTPPRAMLKEIGYTKRYGKYHEKIIPAFAVGTEEGDAADTASIQYAASLLSAKFGLPFSSISEGMVRELFSEQLHNCIEHGKATQVETAFWLGACGFVFALRYDGTFFSSRKTKRMLESRTVITSTRPKPDDLDEPFFCNNGSRFLYSQATSIFVSTEENALYVSYVIPEVWRK